MAAGAEAVGGFPGGAAGVEAGSIPVEACRHPRLLARLRAEREAAADAMIEAIRRQVPLYAALPEESLDDTRSIGLLGYLAVLGLWEQGRLARPDEMANFRAMAADRARRARPLPAVLRSYRVGAVACFDFIATAGEEVLDARDLRSVVATVFGFVDQVCEVVTEVYLETARLVEDHAERATRVLLDDLVTGRFVSGASLVEQAAACGVEFPERPAVAVIADGSGGALTPSPPPDPTGLPALVTRGHTVRIVAEEERSALADELRRAGCRAVLVDAGELVAVPPAYRLAVALLDVGGVPDVLDDADARVAGSLLGLRPALADADVAAVLGPLAGPDERHLGEALLTLFDTGNAVSAARRLDLHPQSLRHRLRRARSLTDRDLTAGWDRFAVESALRVQASGRSRPAGTGEEQPRPATPD